MFRLKRTRLEKEHKIYTENRTKEEISFLEGIAKTIDEGKCLQDIKEYYIENGKFPSWYLSKCSANIDNKQVSSDAVNTFNILNPSFNAKQFDGGCDPYGYDCREAYIRIALNYEKYID